MAWALVLAVAVVGAWAGWQWRHRAGAPRIVETAVNGDLPQGGARPLARISGERGLDSQTLLDAFRADEMSVPPDADREDRGLLVRILQLLADYVGADEAVLWEPKEGEPGRLVAAAWTKGAEPPVPSDADRLLLELAADERRATFNPTGAHLRLAAVGVAVHHGHGAVSVHFREAPALSREDVLARLARFAEEVASRHELLRTRAALAMRTKRLHSLVRTARTLQSSRDPIALEEAIVAEANFVTGAEWAVLVRSNHEGLPAIVRLTEGVPATLRVGLTANPASIVGDVVRSGRGRLHADTRPLQGNGDVLFDATPVPPEARSLIVVPIRRSEKEPSIGALVFGRSDRGTFSTADSHSAYDLGTISAGALDTAWAWQDATLSAKTDQLTGLPNRRAFEEEFQRMIAETDRFGNESALVIVDVDFFKKVNDTYGHDAGDQVLKQVGATLLAMKRTTDKVARLGGEELAILLPQTDRGGAVEAAERCRRAIEALAVRTSVGTIRVTASFGVAMYAARSQGAGSLFDRADQALYAAKHGGRNQVVVAPT